MAMTLKAARVNAGYTQLDVANRLGVSTTTVSGWETGESRIKATDFKTLCDLYGCAMNEVSLPEKSAERG